LATFNVVLSSSKFVAVRPEISVTKQDNLSMKCLVFFVPSVQRTYESEGIYVRNEIRF